MTGGSSRVRGNTSGSAQNQSSEGGLRNVRINKQKAAKEPQKVSLLRRFRPEDKKSPGSPNTESSQKINSDSKSNSRSKSRGLHRRMAVASPVLSECMSVVRPGERNSHFKTITTNKHSFFTLSKPVFVGAPSPEREEDEEEMEGEKAAVTKEVKNKEEEGEGEREPSTPQQGQETSPTWMLLKDFRVRKIAFSQDQESRKYPIFCIQSSRRKKNKGCESVPEEPPLGGVSTKTLISNMKRALNSPDGDDDDQDSTSGVSVASDVSTASDSSEGDHQRSQDIAVVYVKEEEVKKEDERGESYSSDTSHNASVNSLKRALSSSDLDQDSQDSPVTQIKSKGNEPSTSTDGVNCMEENVRDTQEEEEQHVSNTCGTEGAESSTVKPACLDPKRKQEEACQVMKSMRPQYAMMDEYQHFGNLIACKIRKLSTQHAKNTVQHLVQNILYEAEQGHYDNPSDNNHQ